MRRGAIPSLPGRAACRTILHYGERVRDPLERLQFFYWCARHGEQYSRWVRRWPFCRRFYRLALLEFLSRSSDTAKDGLPKRDRAFLWTFRARRKLWSLWKMTLVSAMVLIGLGGGWALRRPAPPESKPHRDAGLSVPPKPPASRDSREGPSAREIWLVETDGMTDLYSNGLQLSNRYRTYTGPRLFPVFPRGGDLEAGVESRDRPLGLVFHATESDLVPLQRTNNQRLRYQGEALLRHIQRNTLYNFLIDRFGRVFRVVPESQYADHAGNSMWADAGELYLNLNHSFVGVAFEMPSATHRDGLPAEQAVTPAQLAGGRMLTQMLRAKFGIVAGNVVTHEMVSLNPSRGLIGYHTDWQGRFPFESLGLPNNYQRLMPSVAEWGFRYDAQFVRDVGGRVWEGVRLSQQNFRREAATRELSLTRYRRQRQQQFRQLQRRWRRLRDEAALQSKRSLAGPHTRSDEESEKAHSNSNKGGN